MPGLPNMQGQIDLFTLLTLVVAIVAIFKLRSVLGSRTGDEEERIARRRREGEERQTGQQGKVVTMPRRDRDETPVVSAVTEVPVAETTTKIRTMAGSNAALSEGLLAILKLDPAFDPEAFLKGAKQAYEMIVTAFSEGNRKILKEWAPSRRGEQGLLSQSIYDAFVDVIAEREARGEQVDQSFVGFSKADILEAEVEKGVASVTVRFVSQLISATRNKSGAVIDGDPSRVKDMTDIWTFSRDISTEKARNNLNWTLVATQSPN